MNDSHSRIPPQKTQETHQAAQNKGPAELGGHKVDKTKSKKPKSFGQRLLASGKDLFSRAIGRSSEARQLQNTLKELSKLETKDSILKGFLESTLKHHKQIHTKEQAREANAALAKLATEKVLLSDLSRDIRVASLESQVKEILREAEKKGPSMSDAFKALHKEAVQAQKTLKNKNSSNKDINGHLSLLYQKQSDLAKKAPSKAQTPKTNPKEGNQKKAKSLPNPLRHLSITPQDVRKKYQSGPVTKQEKTDISESKEPGALQKAKDALLGKAHKEKALEKELEAFRTKVDHMYDLVDSLRPKPKSAKAPSWTFEASKPGNTRRDKVCQELRGLRHTNVADKSELKNLEAKFESLSLRAEHLLARYNPDKLSPEAKQRVVLAETKEVFSAVKLHAPGRKGELRHEAVEIESRLKKEGKLDVEHMQRFLKRKDKVLGTQSNIQNRKQSEEDPKVLKELERMNEQLKKEEGRTQSAPSKGTGRRPAPPVRPRSKPQTSNPQPAPKNNPPPHRPRTRPQAPANKIPTPPPAPSPDSLVSKRPEPKPTASEPASPRTSTSAPSGLTPEELQADLKKRGLEEEMEAVKTFLQEQRESGVDPDAIKKLSKQFTTLFTTYQESVSKQGGDSRAEKPLSAALKKALENAKENFLKEHAQAANKTAKDPKAPIASGRIKSTPEGGTPKAGSGQRLSTPAARPGGASAPFSSLAGTPRASVTRTPTPPASPRSSAGPKAAVPPPPPLPTAATSKKPEAGWKPVTGMSPKAEPAAPAPTAQSPSKPMEEIRKAVEDTNDPRTKEANLVQQDPKFQRLREMNAGAEDTVEPEPDDFWSTSESSSTASPRTSMQAPELSAQRKQVQEGLDVMRQDLNTLGAGYLEDETHIQARQLVNMLDKLDADLKADKLTDEQVGIISKAINVQYSKAREEYQATAVAPIGDITFEELENTSDAILNAMIARGASKADLEFFEKEIDKVFKSVNEDASQENFEIQKSELEVLRSTSLFKEEIAIKARLIEEAEAMPELALPEEQQEIYSQLKGMGSAHVEDPHNTFAKRLKEALQKFGEEAQTLDESQKKVLTDALNIMLRDAQYEYLSAQGEAFEALQARVEDFLNSIIDKGFEVPLELQQKLDGLIDPRIRDNRPPVDILALMENVEGLKAQYEGKLEPGEPAEEAYKKSSQDGLAAWVNYLEDNKASLDENSYSSLRDRLQAMETVLSRENVTQDQVAKAMTELGTLSQSIQRSIEAGASANETTETTSEVDAPSLAQDEAGTLPLASSEDRDETLSAMNELLDKAIAYQEATPSNVVEKALSQIQGPITGILDAGDSLTVEDLNTFVESFNNAVAPIRELIDPVTTEGIKLDLQNGLENWEPNLEAISSSRPDIDLAPIRAFFEELKGHLEDPDLTVEQGTALQNRFLELTGLINEQIESDSQ